MWARELIGKADLRGNEHVLDIGCGDGLVTIEIAKCVPDGSATGIDSSPEMIGFALKRLESGGAGNVSFERMDAREIRFENVFDMAFSNAALHWIKDNASVLRGVERALKPGGKILFQMGGRGNASGMFDALVDVFSRKKWKHFFNDLNSPYRFYGADEYTELLRQSGLKPGRVELIHKDMVHEGADGLAGWFRSTWFPFIDRIPEKMKNEFIYECVGEYLKKQPPDADGRTHMRMARLEVEAVKP